MNARRAANLSPTKTAFLFTEDNQMFRWSGTEGQLLVYEALNPEDLKLLGMVSPDQADDILNQPGWKPGDTDNWLQDWAWRAAYAIGRTLHLPGFHKDPQPAPLAENPVASPAEKNSCV